MFSDGLTKSQQIRNSRKHEKQEKIRQETTQTKDISYPVETDSRIHKD